MKTNAYIRPSPRDAYTAFLFFVIALSVSGAIFAVDHVYDVPTGDPVIVDTDLSGSGLIKSGDGTLVLNGNNTYTDGTEISGGTIVLGSDTALGTWVAGDPETMQTGMLLAVTGDSTIKVTEDRTVTNHFQLGTETNRTGSLTFDIASGSTLTISGVENTSENEYLEDGGAINVNVYAATATAPSSLKFIGGHLVFDSNKTNFGGAVGTHFGDTGQHIVLDFTGLESVTFIGNSATYDGGGVYAYSDEASSSVTLGDRATFTSNSTGAYGGGIYSWGDSSSSVTLGAHTAFIDNEAELGGGIYAYSWNGSSSVSVNAHTLFQGNIADVSGGAIDIKSDTTGTLTLDTGTGDATGAIALTGNTANGTPNAVYMIRTALEISGDGNVYFDDPISSGTTGHNSLVKSGTGFVQFLGDNRLNTTNVIGNSVDIQSGTFRLADSATFDATGAGAFNVESGATLAGNGTITAVNNGFTISGTISPDSDRFEIPEFVDKNHPEATTRYNYFKVGRTTLANGKEIGTLTLVGDVELNNATLLIDINETGNDKINITGDLTLTGTTTVTPTLLAPATGSHTILSATGSVDNQGTFDVTQTYLFNITADVMGNNIILNVTRAGNRFSDAVRGSGNRNAIRAASGADWLFNANLLTQLGNYGTALVNLSQNEMPGAFAQSHGEVFASGIEAGVILHDNFTGLAPSIRSWMTNPGQMNMHVRGSSQHTAAVNRWGTFTGDWLGRDNIGSYSGYDLQSTGTVVGFDRNVSLHTRLGIALGYDYTEQDFDTINSAAKMHSMRTLLYGGWRCGNRYIDGHLGYSKSWHKTTRWINIPNFNATARSEYNDDLLSAGLEFGRMLNYGCVRVNPYFGIRYVMLDSPGISETGAGGANLSVAGKTYNSLRIPVGLRLERDIRVGYLVLTPELRAAYVAELCDDSAIVNTRWAAAPSASFEAHAGARGRHSGRFGTGLNARISKSLDFRVDWDYEVYENTNLNELSAAIYYRW